MLYDPAIHRKHQEGYYRSLKPGTYPRKIIQLPHSCKPSLSNEACPNRTVIAGVIFRMLETLVYECG